MSMSDVFLGCAVLLVPAVVIGVVAKLLLGRPASGATPRSAASPETQAHQQAARNSVGGFGSQG